jgi:hypothetical protein
VKLLLSHLYDDEREITIQKREKSSLGGGGSSRKSSLKIDFPDAKDLTTTATQTEANINLTEAFENTMEANAIESSDNESLKDGGGGGGNSNGAQTSTPTDFVVSMTSQTTMQNRLHLASVATTEQLFAVSNEHHAAVALDTASTHSTKFNSTNNTIPSNDNDNDNKNFSNTSFSVKTTTMKPCKREM